MSLHRRLIGVFVVYVAILLVGGTAVALIARDRDEARDEERTTGIVRERIIQLRAAFADQETGQRGYLLTGEASFLDPFDRGQRRAEALLSNHELTTGELAPASTAVRRAWERWHSGSAEPEIEIRRTQGGEAAAAAVAAGSGRERFDRLRVRVTSLERAAAAADASASRHVDALRTRLNWAFGAVLACALAWTSVAVWLVRRWVTTPLDDLGRAVQAARTGAVGATVTSHGPAEIARLGATVEDMRLQLVNARVEAVHAREAIEQSASVVLTLRSQLESEIGELPDGWTVAAELRPAEGLVAGDCYDVVRSGANRFHVVLVDISGHGAVSGVLALRCKELLRAGLRNGLEPGPALEFASAQLDDIGEETFLSAIVASVALDTGDLAYANAGHPPGLLCADERVIPLEPTGPIVGPFPASGWATRHARISPGATLALYTDGIVESRDADRREFGMERLAELVRGSSCDEAEAIAKRCVDEVDGFHAGRLTDDVTVVLVCRGPRS